MHSNACLLALKPLIIYSHFDSQHSSILKFLKCKCTIDGKKQTLEVSVHLLQIMLHGNRISQARGDFRKLSAVPGAQTVSQHSSARPWDGMHS